MKRPVRIPLAVCSLLAAAALILLGVDALRWPGVVRAGDVRFQAAPANPGLWRASVLFPFGDVQGLLGLADDLAYRRALQTFRRGRPRVPGYFDTRLITLRARAQQALGAIVDASGDRSRRSAAANLVGVLGFANAVADPNQSPDYLHAAIESFRSAISLDPGNADAKYNLELALVRLRQAEQQTGTQPTSPSRGGTKRGAGNGQPGTGY
jgi:hypothetical protein